MYKLNDDFPFVILHAGHPDHFPVFHNGRVGVIVGKIEKMARRRDAEPLRPKIERRTWPPGPVATLDDLHGIRRIGACGDAGVATLCFFSNCCGEVVQRATNFLRVFRITRKLLITAEKGN